MTRHSWKRGDPNPCRFTRRTSHIGPAADEADRLRTAARREQPFEPDEDVGPRERSAGDETRKSWLRRHPIAVGLALLCMLLAVPAGYLYWDYTSHFEYTDDAYIAARQFAIAPEVAALRTYCGRHPGMSEPLARRRVAKILCFAGRAEPQR